MARNQPPAVISSSATLPKDAHAVNEQQASQSSPKVSDMTTIVSGQVPDRPALQKSKPSNTFWASGYPVTGQEPPHSESQPIHTSAGPPLPPLVVRSNKIQGIVDHARSMFANSPARYLCFFPQCGYTIHDAWDSRDIHIDSAEFLTEVLTFITRDNVHRARTYAHEWSQKNRHRLDFIAGEVPRMYNSNDPLSIVDRIFINGETQSYPREFLWHVANMIRTGMVTAALKPQVTTAADTDQDLHKVDENWVGNNVVDTKLMANVKPNIQAEEKETRPVAEPGDETHSESPIQGALTAPSSAPSTIVQPPLVTHSTQTLPVVPSHPPTKSHHSQPVEYSMGPQSNMLSPHMNTSTLRYPKGSRKARQGSSSYNQPPPSHQGRIENHPVAPMFGPQPPRLSGTISATQSPRFTAPLPMGVQPMMNPGNSMMPFPRHPALTSPPNTLSQMSYGLMGETMMHPSTLPPQPVPYNGPLMDLAQQDYPYGPPVLQCIPIGDMTNGPQYPYTTPPQRMEQCPGTNRRISYTNKQPGLFNPYGTEKPNFGMIPSQQGPRKVGRNSFSNPTGRGRKTSLSSYSRSGYGQQNFDRGDRGDRGDRNGLYGGNRQPEATSSRSFSNNNLPPMEVDPTITNDKERGCDEGWIGLNANYVTSLWVGNLPRDPDPTPEELTKFFEVTLRVPVLSVKMSTDKNNSPIAYVNFHNSNDVRKGLAINGHYHRGRPITVKVPRHYYMIQDPARMQGSNYYSSSRNAQQSTEIVSRAHQATSQPTGPFLRAPDLTHYSPQDARSGLVCQMSRSQASEVPARNGSPEPRIPKKQQKPSTEKAIARHTSTPQMPFSASTPTPTQDKGEGGPALSVAGEWIAGQYMPSTEQETSTMDDSTESDKIVEESTVVKNGDVEPNFNNIQYTEHSKTPPSETDSTATKVTEDELPNPAAHVLKNDTQITLPLLTTDQIQPAAEKQTPDTTDQDKPVKKLAAEEAMDMQPFNGQISEPFDVTASGSQHSGPVSGSASHTVLEEEDKNDLSYHSAQEMQSDSVGPEEEAIPSVSSDTQAAAGVEPPTTTFVEDDTTLDPTAERIELPAADTIVFGPEKPKQATNASKQAAKTESLSIFAKSKAQKKKEKDAQKKGKKKAKAIKAQSTSTSTLGVPEKAKAEPAERPARPSVATDQDCVSYAKALVLAKVYEASVGATMNHKSNQVATSSDLQLPALPTNDVGVEGDEGAAGGKIPVPREETTVQTQLRKVQNSSSAQSQIQDMEAAALSYERASETVVLAKNPDMLNAALAREEPSTKADNAKQQNGKKSKLVSNLMVAIPNMKDMKRKSSASSIGCVVASASCAMPQGTGESLRNEAKVSKSDKNISQSVKEEPESGTAPETASVASSATLHDVVSPTMSPSPTGATFYTPAQTPTALEPKKERRKKKKSKPKKKVPTSPHPDEPFVDQMREIERVESNSLRGMQDLPYYNKHAARPAETPEESAALDKQIVEPDVMTLIQAYYPQKQTSMQSHIDRSFALQKQNTKIRSLQKDTLVQSLVDDSDPPRKYQPFSPEMFSEDIEGRKVPLGQQILETDDAKTPKAGTTPFFQPKEEDE